MAIMLSKLQRFWRNTLTKRGKSMRFSIKFSNTVAYPRNSKRSDKYYEIAERKSKPKVLFPNCDDFSIIIISLH